MKIKICGIRSEDDIQLMNYYKPDFIGFIFFKKSPRYIDFKKAKALKNQLDSSIKAVGVFVNENINKIIYGFNLGIFDYVQLHGDEKQEQIDLLKKNNIPVIKAIKIKNKEDFNLTKVLDPDYFLFDIKDKNLVGGTGKNFDWKLLKFYNKPIPFFLAGGINSKNINNTFKTKAQVIDISSGVEIKYKKNQKKVEELFNEYYKNQKRN